jgi:translocation protein SEC72
MIVTLWSRNGLVHVLQAWLWTAIVCLRECPLSKFVDLQPLTLLVFWVLAENVVVVCSIATNVHAAVEVTSTHARGVVREVRLAVTAVKLAHVYECVVVVVVLAVLRCSVLCALCSLALALCTCLVLCFVTDVGEKSLLRCSLPPATVCFTALLTTHCIPRCFHATITITTPTPMTTTATALPITYDPISKKVALSETVPLSHAKDLQLEVNQLNTLYADFIKINGDIPPPPTKENFTTNLSMMVKKMHESATALMRTRKFDEAAKQFNVALGMALARSKFESFQGTMPELIICLIGRCDAYNNSNRYVEALQDAEVLVLLGSTMPDNHLRRGIANLNLGELLAAKSDFERGLAFNSQHPLLIKLHSMCTTLIAEENGDL